MCIASAHIFGGYRECEYAILRWHTFYHASCGVQAKTRWQVTANYIPQHWGVIIAGCHKLRGVALTHFPAWWGGGGNCWRQHCWRGCVIGYIQYRMESRFCVKAAIKQHEDGRTGQARKRSEHER